MTETGYDSAGAITDKLKEMTPDEAVKMVRELCAALGADADSFHGNIWPGNVRLDWEGKAVLGEPSEEPANRREAEQVEFLAPESFWDNEGSAAADVYSLALLLYAGCSGGFLPFQPKGGLLTAKDRSSALRKRMKGEPVSAPGGVTPALAAVMEKALSYEPEERYITCAAFLSALSETDESLPAAAPEEISDDALEQPEEPAGTIPEDADEPTDAPEAPEDASECFEEEPEEALDDTSRQSAGEEENRPEDELPPFDAFEGLPPELMAVEEPETREPPEEEDPAPLADTVPEPEAETRPEPEEAPAPASPVPREKYTVRKDFEKRGRKDRAAVPAANRKKRASPLIPILCVLAVAVIAAAVLLIHHSRSGGEDESVSVPYTIEPAQETPSATEAPQPLDEQEEAEEPEAEPEEEAEEAEAPEETAPVAIGSGVVDGMDVEPVSDVVEVSDTGVNLRTGPGTSYDVADNLPRGTKLTRTGIVNGWSQVQYEGQEYYVATNLVFEIEGEAPAAPAETAKADAPETKTEASGTLLVTSDVNIRSGPGQDYEKLGEAKRGTVLTAIGRSEDGKWYLVTVDGIEGYVNRRLVSVQSYSSVTEMTGTLAVTRECNVRSGPGTGYDILRTAEPGDTFTLTGLTENNWYRVSLNGEDAYIAGNYAAVQD